MRSSLSSTSQDFSSPSTVAHSTYALGRESESNSEGTLADQASQSSGSDVKQEHMATAPVTYRQTGAWDPALVHTHTHAQQQQHHHHQQHHQHQHQHQHTFLGKQQQAQEEARAHCGLNGTTVAKKHQDEVPAMPNRPSVESSRHVQASGNSNVPASQRAYQFAGATVPRQYSHLSLSSSYDKLPKLHSSNSFDRRTEQVNHAGTSSGTRDHHDRYGGHSYNPSQSTFAGNTSGCKHFDPCLRDLSLSTNDLPRQPLQSRFFGLGPSLQAQTHLADPAFFPGGVVPPESVTALGVGSEMGESPSRSKETPAFSIELKARSFDHRGYPVYGGRAAPISGFVRMPKSEGCDVAIKISAHTTSGSTATVWDGVAFQPATSGSQRTIFSTTDTFQAAEGHIDSLHAASSSSSPAASSASMRALADNEDDSSILVIPFTVNLPVGGSTKIVDGEMATVAVPLPPSFEMSSEQDNKDRAMSKNINESFGGSSGGVLASGAASFKTSKTRMTAATVKEAVEAGLREVYRVGCFYSITFILLPASGKVQEGGRKFAGALFGLKKNKAAKKIKGPRSFTVPFVFLGEMSSQPSPSSIIPPIRPAILRQPAQPLSPEWESEIATAKWPGKLFKTMKRNVELELFLPSKTIQAPSVVPILLVIRPEDPEMLPKPHFPLPGSPMGSPGIGYGGNPSVENASVPRRSYFPGDNCSHLRVIAKSSSADSSSTAGGCSDVTTVNGHPSEPHKEGGDPSLTQQVNGLAQVMQSSTSISHSPAHATSASSHPPASPSTTSHHQSAQKLQKKISRSAFSFTRRPDSTVSRESSDESNISYTVRGGGLGSSDFGDGRSQPGLPALVRLSILQNVYYGSSNVNEPPKNKRRLMNVADLEEIDLAKLADGRTQGDLSLLYDRPDAATLVADARTNGVRLLRGVLRIPREATPSFRVQGVEVKYAIKVDLLPINVRSGGSGKPTSGSLAGRAQSSSALLQSSSSPTLPAPASSSPPVTPPYRHSPLAFGVLGSAKKTTTQSAVGSSASSQHPASTLASQSVWAPGAAVPLGLHQHTYEPSMRMSQAPSSVSGRPRHSMDNSEAGFSRRSPSDPTIVGAESAKLQKTVGALWLTVRLVKGKGSL